ncbi:MAG: beta-propeller fold lactonase family protein, partial [Pseudonocardiaceae bacterium]
AISTASATVTGSTTSAPTNTTLPAITGSTVQGQTLTTSNGTWTGNPTSYSYSWNDCDANGTNCSRIPNTNSSTYTLTATDVTHTMIVKVTATNTSGSTPATSTASATVTGSTTTNSSGALAQLPGQAGCVSNDSYGGTAGLCRQASGVRLIQSVAVSPDGKSVYAAAVQSDAVTGFSRDASTGLLSQVPGAGGCVQDPSAVAESGCGAGRALQVPDWVTVSPNGANVYATSFTSQAIDVFSRDATTGGLTQMAGSAGCVSSSASQTTCAPAAGLDAGPGGLTFSPDGKYAYVAGFGNGLGDAGSITTFAVGSDGSLTQLGSGTGCLVDSSTNFVSGCTASNDSTLRGASSIAISPDGNYAYVAARNSQAVTIYARNPTTGTLARVTGATGCVEESGTSPCAQGTAGIGLAGPNSISIAPDGRHVYVSSYTNGSGDTVAVFSRDASTGALTQLAGKQGCFSGGGADPACTAVPVLGGAFAVTTSPDGSYVYVTAYQSNAITVFSADPSGALTPLPGQTQCVSASSNSGACAQGVALGGPLQAAVSPDGAFVYVAGHQNSAIDIFATEPSATGPPSNSALPAITGTTTPGQTLTATAGTWAGTQTGYAYQWQDCDTNGANCTPIAGASGYSLSGAPATNSYTLTPADAGHTIRVQVTATNSAGSTPAISTASATVTGSTTSAPTNTALPTITGTSIQGQTLTAGNGTWTGSPTSYAYQ